MFSVIWYTVFSTKFVYTLLALFVTLYLYAKYCLTYWKRKKVFSPPTKSWMGHIGDNIDVPISIRMEQLYHEHKEKRFIGLYIFIVKQLLVTDLDLIKNILSKDYYSFEGHGFKLNKRADPLGQHLFNLEGEEWKRVRVKLTPTFTSSKMKYMFDTVYDCNLVMLDYLKKEIKDGKDVEIKDVLAMLGTDVISSCAFGLESNTFKDHDSLFRKMGKKALEVTWWNKILDLMSITAPWLSVRIPVGRSPKAVSVFFQTIVKETIAYRESNNIKRNDFLQLLIEMKNSDKSSEYHITLEEIVPQVFVFFLAGFETSAITVQFSLLELAKNPKVRDELVLKLDRELEKNNNNITYEFIHGLTCLHEVIDETIRMYPSVPVLFRNCTVDYKIPNSDVVIEKGTSIMIPILGIHHDPDIYPEPEKFNPERFSAENKQTRHNYAHIPFGEGPRFCIGNRFAYMQSKIALLTILSHFHVELSPRTELPLQFDPNAFLLHTKGNLMMKLSPRNK